LATFGQNRTVMRNPAHTPHSVAPLIPAFSLFSHNLSTPSKAKVPASRLQQAQLVLSGTRPFSRAPRAPTTTLAASTALLMEHPQVWTTSTGRSYYLPTAPATPFNSSATAVQLGGTIAGKPGFQYSAVSLSVNAQYMKIVDGSGTTQYSTGLGRCVSSQCFDDIYNYNPQVLELTQGDHASAGCLEMTQQARALNGATTGPFYPAGI
jgi:hypothetical protein